MKWKMHIYQHLDKPATIIDKLCLLWDKLCGKPIESSNPKNLYIYYDEQITIPGINQIITMSYRFGVKDNSLVFEKLIDGQYVIIQQVCW